MARLIPDVEETELNMTPMIDVVFQLIVFFLLSLKFKTVDKRIDSFLPKDCGIVVDNQMKEEVPTVSVKLFRRNMSDPENAQTIIRVGNHHTFALPKGDWDDKDVELRLQEYDRTFSGVRAAIAETWRMMDNDPETRGEIKTPRPKGLQVPHGDVMRVLDTFIDIGLRNVDFEGTAAPMPVPGGGGFATQGG